jgi:polar amino acid transport system permease protein
VAYQFDFSALLPYWGQFVRGIGLTLLLSVLAVAIGFVVGLLTVLASLIWTGRERHG